MHFLAPGDRSRQLISLIQSSLGEMVAVVGVVLQGTHTFIIYFLGRHFGSKEDLGARDAGFLYEFVDARYRRFFVAVHGCGVDVAVSGF